MKLCIIWSSQVLSEKAGRYTPDSPPKGIHGNQDLLAVWGTIFIQNMQRRFDLVLLFVLGDTP